MTNEEIRNELQKAINGEHVMLFMKGTPEQPRCGFSAQVVGILEATGAEYSALDVLPDPRIRQELSALSNWPTIPQLFVDGTLVGGCDIVTEMFEAGELTETLGVPEPEAAVAERTEPGQAQAPPLQID
jgi:monothiol glutaredoxin